MFTRPGRTKKLLVAFHFQFANQAAWKCDDCRRSGLENARRCAWLGGGGQEDGRPVWSRNQVVCSACPKSYITPQSWATLEAYYAWRAAKTPMEALPARLADAFFLLESEVSKELASAQG